MGREQPESIGELCRAFEREYGCWSQLTVIVHEQLAERLEGL